MNEKEKIALGDMNWLELRRINDRLINIAKLIASNRKVVDYFLCICEDSVTDHLSEGYELYGNPFAITHDSFDQNVHEGWAQAVVKYE
jgi:hypothetical protein